MRNTNNTYKTQGGDNLVITVKENAPLLEYLINNVSESRSKLKATLQGRGIAVNGRMVLSSTTSLKLATRLSSAATRSRTSSKVATLRLYTKTDGSSL